MHDSSLIPKTSFHYVTCNKNGVIFFVGWSIPIAIVSLSLLMVEIVLRDNSFHTILQDNVYIFITIR